MKWAIGKAGHDHWAVVPKQFDERLHKLVCICGEPLYLTSHHPYEAGYTDAQRSQALVVIQ